MGPRSNKSSVLERLSESDCRRRRLRAAGAMGSMADLARQRIDEIKFRNQGGNMENIPGFNFEYNDIDPEERARRNAPPPPKPKSQELGGMPRARRASDGAMLSVPYKVVLKPKKPGVRPPALHGRMHER